MVSTGWVSSIVLACTTGIWCCSTNGPKRRSGRDPSTRISSSYAPMGAGVAVDGGYLVNGSELVLGCDHSWIARRRPGHQGRPAGGLRQFLPAQRIRDQGTCGNVVGLRGTGSNTLVVKDVLCPGTALGRTTR